MSRATLNALHGALTDLLSPYAYNPAKGRPDWTAWGHKLVADHPVSMRRLLAGEDGRRLFAEEVIDVDRYDDIGDEIPNIIDDAARAALWAGIEAALREPFEAPAVEPELFADWVASHAAEPDVAAWCAFVHALAPEDGELRLQLGTHDKAFALYARKRHTLRGHPGAARSGDQARTRRACTQLAHTDTGSTT